MAKTLKILTCVSNVRGAGPGHSAIVVDSTVYTFENAGVSGNKGWFNSNSSGWVKVDLDKYLQQNEHRPVILQTLNEKVNPDKVEAFVQASAKADDDYIGSGVCSSLVASAINAGYPPGFDPPWIDTPWKVYDLARKKGIVASESGTWKGAGKLPVLDWASIVNKLKADYPNAPVPVDR